MSDDWDTVTKIGSKVRPSGSGPDREKVIRGSSALNAAQRQGAAISTEKKYATGNATASNLESQHLTKVDRSDEIVKPKTVGKLVGQAVQDNRTKEGVKLSQKELATKCNTTQTVIASIEQGTAVPDQKVLSALERVLGVKLRGDNIGEPRFAKKK